MNKLNNKGFTLVETLLCFVILGIIMVIASQIIYSSTEAYYYNRSMSYGMQAAQIVSTELRGEIEDALPLRIYETESDDYSDYYIVVRNTATENSIEFITSNGKQVRFTFDKSNEVLKKYTIDDVYNKDTLKKKDVAEIGTYSAEPTKVFDSKYIGMGYEVKDISFRKFNKREIESSVAFPTNKPSDLGIADYPVLEMTIKVGNNQYDEYECKEYIPLYNFYGLINEYIEFEDIILIN